MNILILTNRFSSLLEPVITCSEYSVCGFAYFPIDIIECSVIDLLSKYEINHEVFHHANEFLYKYMQQVNPDLAVVYALHHILPPQIYNMPRYGSINLHPSLLPKYKGKNPWCAQYKNIPENFGMTIHKVSCEVDGGTTISQCVFPYEESMSLNEFKEFSLQQYGFPLLREAIKKISI